MMHESRLHLSRVRSLQLAVAVSLGLAAFGPARTAHASRTYPPEVQKALEQQFKGQTFCVPQCITCHLTNDGGFLTMNVFGKNLQAYGKLPALMPNLVVGAFDAYFKA